MSRQRGIVPMRHAALATVALLSVSPAFGPTVVHPGDPGVLASRMPLTTDTMDNYVLDNGVRKLASTTVRTIAKSQTAAESVYEIRTLHSTVDGDTTASIMVVRSDDLSLVFHRVKGARDSAAVTASRTHLSGWVVLPGQPIALIDRDLAHPVFGVEGQIPWLMPLLPLATGYRAVVPRFSQWEGGVKWDSVTVIGSEPLTIAGKAFDCWKVDAGPLGPPGYRMYRWVDKASRRVVQSVLRSETGGREFWGSLRP